MAKALYRKYRPKTLAEVVGQKQVTDVLAAALKQGKISHAYLFIGPRGTGKTSVARIFAHEINGFPYEIEDDYIDIIEIDGASNRGIDNIRELREKALIAPTSGKYKVYIIDEVHMLTKEAFNALLKILEEPPKHIVFIMATTDAYKVPVTITSRAQTYTFSLADTETMFSFLRSVAEKEGIKIQDEALSLIVKRGGGSFRDTLSLLDQISTLSSDVITKDMVVSAMGLPADEKIVELLETYLTGDVVKITTVLKNLLSTGVKPETLAEEIISFIIENPKPEYFALLEKLPNVKAPFAEAKLLVALARGLSKHTFSASGLEFSSTSYAGTPREPSLRDEPLGSVRNIGVENSNQKHDAKKVCLATRAESQETSATPAETSEYSDPRACSPSSSRRRQNEPPVKTGGRVGSRVEYSGVFDWEEFLEKVKSANEAVYSQLSKTTYEFENGVLRIYPEKKIVKTILSSKNNKQILTTIAGGIKIEIMEIGEKEINDPTISKISDIMGGEVINDGGENPF